MRIIGRVFLLAAIGILGSVGLLLPAEGNYLGGENYAGWPSYHFKDGSTHCAGKCFAVRWFNGKNLMLSPLHVLGPAGGYDHQLRTSELNNLIDYVEILDPAKVSVVETAKTSLLKENVPLNLSDANSTGDLVVFELPSNSKLPVLGMSATLPAVGEKVTVVSHDNSSQSAQCDRYTGTVSFAGECALVVHMDQSVTAISSSGSPIINSKNELIGMMVGTQDEARTYITGMASSCIYKRLLQELPH